MEKNSISVLILDDEPLVCQTVETMLNAIGCLAQSTCNPTQFIDLACAESFDLLIVDLMMPLLSGEEVAALLAAESVKTPLIIMSGSDSNLLKTAALSAREKGLQVIGTLRKPFFVNQLQTVLQRLTSSLNSAVHQPAAHSYTRDDVLKGIRDHQFFCVYQPKVGLPTHEPEGVEVLLRWQHPILGAIPPSEFIIFAEREGLIDDLTQFAIAESLTWFSEIIQRVALNNLSIAINISALVFSKDWLLDFLMATCQQNAVPPQRIILEITESAVLDDQADVLKRALDLRLRGFRFSLDDFGTGYSSLKQLVRLPLSELKIDKSFVLSYEDSDESKQIMRATVELAQSLGLKTVAEGVEREEIATYLRQIGCDTLQGYLFAKPLEGSRAEAWLMKQAAATSQRRSSLARAIVGPCEKRSVNFSYITHFIQYFLRFDVAFISLVEGDHVFVRSAVGVEETIIPLNQSLVQYVMKNNRTTTFDNFTALSGMKVNLSPLLSHGLNFYAGFPLYNSNGLFIGSLCALHRSARRLSLKTIEVLEKLAHLVEFEIHHFIETSKHEHMLARLDEERYKRLLAIVKDTDLSATLIRLTPKDSALFPVAPLNEALRQSVQAWDYVCSLDNVSALVLLIHPTGESPVEFVVQRLETRLADMHDNISIEIAWTEQQTQQPHSLQSLFGRLADINTIA